VDKLSAGVSDHLGLPSQSHLSVDGRLTLSCLCGDCGVRQELSRRESSSKRTQLGNVLLPSLWVRSLGLSDPPTVAIRRIYLVIL